MTAKGCSKPGQHSLKRRSNKKIDHGAAYATYSSSSVISNLACRSHTSLHKHSEYQFVKGSHSFSKKSRSKISPSAESLIKPAVSAIAWSAVSCMAILVVQLEPGENKGDMVSHHIES